MSPINQPVPEELREAYEDGNLIVVVGPELSSAAGLPGTEQLASQLLELAVERGLHLDQARLQGWIGAGRSAEALGLLERRFGAAFAREVERRLSDQGAVIPSLAQTIAQLSEKLRAVYTTSLDRLLERAFLDDWPSFAVPRADLAQRRALIFKLRGTLEFAQSWVLTSEQRAREFSSRSLRQAVFEAAYAAHRLVFVGFEPESDMLSCLLDMIEVAGDGEQGPSHFIILDKCALEQRETLEGRGLELIRGDAEELLAELGGLEDPSEVSITAKSIVALVGCPYPGLDAYSQDHAKLFFGRQAEISQAASRLGGLGDDHRRWLSIEGPSGVGKSSFALAGIVRAIQRGFGLGLPSRWRVASLRPGTRPMAALARALFEAFELPGLASADDEAVARLLERRAPGSGVLVVVDQLEELVTLSEADEREQFCRVLATALERGALYLVTTLRSDFVPAFQALAPALAGLLNEKAERYALPPISRVGLREAIVAPAQLCAIEIDAEVVEQLARDAELLATSKDDASAQILTRASTLPLVAHVLRGLWDARDPSTRRIELQDYTGIGGLSGALSRSADGLLAQLDDAEQSRAKTLLLAMVRIDGAGAGATRRTLTREEAVQLAGEEVLTKLSGGGQGAATGARVLVVHVEDEQAWVELVHETLLREWGTLARWIDADRGQLVLDSELERQAARWHQRGRPSRGLPRGQELAGLLQGRPRGADDAVQRAYQAALRRASFVRRSISLSIAGLVALVSLGVAWGFAGKNEVIRDKNEDLEQKQVELEREKRALQDSASTEKSLRARMLIPADREGEALALAVEAVGAYGPDWERAPPAAAVAGLERVLADDALIVRESVICAGHTDKLRAVAFAPDGARVATASEDHSARVFDAVSGRQLAALEGHEHRVVAVAWSPSGEQLASASLDKSAKLWTAGTGKLVASLDGHEAPVYALAYSPDGAQLASGSVDGQVKIWAADSGALQTTITDYEGPVGLLAYSPDGAELAIAGGGERVTLWSPGKSSRALVGHRDELSALAFMPDGTRLVSASLDKSAIIWALDSGQALTTLEASDKLTALAISPDGTRLATAGVDGSGTIWDAASGKRVARLDGHADMVTIMAWAPDGARLASASLDDSARLWDADSGKLLVTYRGHDRGLLGLAFSPDGARLASASLDGSARIWSSAIENPIGTHEGHDDAVRALAWAPDGARVATASTDKSARIWAPDSGRQLARLDGHAAAVRGLVYTSGGSKLVTASYDESARVWDADSGKQLAVLEGHEHYVYGIVASPDGVHVATSSYDNSAKIWTLDGASPVATLDGHEDHVLGLAYSPDGTRLASASRDKSARIWNAETGASLATLTGHESVVIAVAYSPDGTRLASMSQDQTARIWDAETGRQLRILAGHDGPLAALAWAPDGAQLASASEDASARIWDAESGDRVATLTGHEGAVLALAYAADGARIVTGGADGKLGIWDASSGEQLALLAAHEGPIVDIVFSADGARFGSASEDHSARIWDAATNELVAALEDRIGRRQQDGIIDWPVPPPELLEIACRRLQPFAEYGGEAAAICEALIGAGD